MILGISLYPEQETLQQIEEYIQLASSYGFTKIFTSLFSVEGTKEEIFNYFKNFTDIAHKYHMRVSGDVNSMFFNKMEATPTDLSIFKAMGIDIIRMDMSFNDERDAILINNTQGIDIEMSTGFIKVIEEAIANGANPKRITTCHNFYPQRYTAPSLEDVNELNEYWKKKGIKTAIFISSNVKGSHGPWPVSDGLPTIEEHRDLPIEVQLKHCISLKNVDEIIIGNAFASKEEFEAIDSMMKQIYVEAPSFSQLGDFANYLPKGTLTRIPFKVIFDKGVSNQEKEILFFPMHNDFDCVNYMLRSRITRMIFKGVEIPERKIEDTLYHRGDILIVNDNLKHYRGEIQIALKDMKVDGQRNRIGHIDENDMMILQQIQKGDLFGFYE